MVMVYFNTITNNKNTFKKGCLYMTYDEFLRIEGDTAIRRLYFDKAFIKVGEHKYKYLPNAIFDDPLFQDMCRFYGFANVNKCYKMIQSSASKQKRILDKIQCLLIQNRRKYFVTLTLNDEHIGYKLSTYRKHICTLFKGCDFVFNEDYGLKHARLHFHGVIATDFSLFELCNLWDYGFSDFRLITSFDDKPLMKYIYKLRNHFVKDSTKCGRIITPRKYKNC